jgi:hypothetical protein
LRSLRTVSKFVAYGSDDNTIRLWNIQSGHTCRIYHGHLHCVTPVRFLEDGDLIVSASMDRTIRIWSCTEGTQLATYDTCGFEKQVSISRDGRWLRTDRGTVILSSQDLVLCDVPLTSLSHSIQTANGSPRTQKDYQEGSCLARLSDAAYQHNDLANCTHVANHS